MALKDKLMTLEDFKAVRDVDVASNSAQFTEIKADLDNLEPGLSDAAKAALLACFANVAWSNTQGQTYYDALENALSESGDNRHLPSVYTWLYDSTDKQILSSHNYVAKTIGGNGGSELIIDNQLVLNTPYNDNGSNFIRFTLSDPDTNNGKISVRVKLNELPINPATSTSSGSEGFRIQVSNGSGGAQAFFEYYPTGNGNELHLFYYEGTSRKHVDISSYSLSEYHVIEVSLKNNAQIISIDGDVIINSNVLSTNYCTNSAILNQSAGSNHSPNGCITTVDWIAYYEE